MEHLERICAVGAGCFLLFAGCSFHKSIEKNAVDFNRAVERSQNELLLLNILRSKERHPRHFTALTQVRGNLSGGVEAGLEIPFGGGATDEFTFSPKGSVSSSPNFDVAVLDSQEFVNGIMEPVEAELFEYYRRQGWPLSILLYLMVRKFQFTDTKGNLAEITNYPLDDQKMRQFETIVEIIVASKAEIVVDSIFVPLDSSPDFDRGALQAADLIQARAQGLDVKLTKDAKKNDRIQFGHLEKMLMISCSQCQKNLSPDHAADLPEAEKWKDLQRRWEDLQKTFPALEKFPAHFKLVDPTPSRKMSLRSPEAIIYYLGEIARRLANDKFKSPCVSYVKSRRSEKIVCRSGERLFVVRPGTNSAADVSVSFDGQSYYIPSGAAGGRSMHCLALLAQLLALHKSRQELPTTPIVTISGGK